MTEKKITAANAGDEQMRKLYQTAFPVEEQIPYADLVRLIGEMPLDFTAYYDGEELIGFTIVYPRRPYNWFWYFAVRDELRGKGYGQEILTGLIERYKDRPCILDMESPEQLCDNIEQRKRRHAFYLRNGFRDTNVFRTYDGITYTIMMIGEGTFTKHDYDDIISDLRRFWQPE
jgi:GNAT superfamily N-acetyltransferase